MSEETAHAKLSASGSSIWINCPGSIKAQENYTNTSSSASEEGTAAHELAELCLTHGADPSTFVGTLSPSNFKILIDKEMAEHVQSYIDIINSVVGTKFYEQRVDFSDYALGGFGTADCIVINDDDRVLSIIDLKYGKGHRVEAYHNTQLQLYALGALADYGQIYEFDTVNLIIAQPRLDNIGEWSTTPTELYKFGEFVKHQAELALSDDAPRVPGESQCQWCRAKHKCPELYQLTSDTLMSDFDNCDLKQVNTLSDAQLKKALDNSKLITSWLDAIESYVRDKINNGDEFVGYKMVAGRSSRSWSNEEDAVKVLSEAYSKEELYEESFITVAKAEKLLGKKNMGLLNDLVVKKDGKPTLVPNNDKRISIKISANDFD